MAVKAKVLEFAVALGADGRSSADDHEPATAFGGEWTAEHLVLAGLAKCSLTSLGHFARQRGSTADGSAATHGRVTKREDGAYGFVEIECSLDVTLEPEPDDLAAVLEQAEWGCFVGQSLQPKPAYRWRVNGREID